MKRMITVWERLDGKQRITVISSFLNDEFKLDKSYTDEIGSSLNWIKIHRIALTIQRL